MTDLPMMRNGPQFNEEKIRREVKRFKALGDETRLKMIRLLESGERCVCEMIELFDLGQSTASHHLKILKNAGLIRSRREGKFVYYRLLPIKETDNLFGKGNS